MATLEERETNLLKKVEENEIDMQAVKEKLEWTQG
jgi:hypothetical protein